MDFEKKLKVRLYTAVIYLLLGLLMIIGTFITKTDNSFISSFGLMLAIIGIAKIRNYFIITKSEETIKKQQIAEEDERNISIMYKARSTAFLIYILLLCVGIIVLSFFNMHDATKWIACLVSLLVLIYWICYWVYQKKS